MASWTARSSAHEDCRRRWTGRTRFLLRAGGDKELLEAGAGRLPAELEPRRTEDSKPRDGGRNKAKNVEASKANRVEAKVKKSSHHYIPARYSLESLRMRCSGCWAFQFRRKAPSRVGVAAQSLDSGRRPWSSLQHHGFPWRREDRLHRRPLRQSWRERIVSVSSFEAQGN